MKQQLCLAVLLHTFIVVAHAAPVKIYAAASLTNAITDISKLYQAKYSDVKITPVFGASSMLAKQLERGAEGDIYFSADEEWMNYLVQKKLADQSTVKPLLTNQLVLISPKNMTVQFKPQSGFNFATSFKGYLCTGQMESVPVGKYAKQSLTALNWLDSLKGRIVGTDDVRSALAFVERGECQVGIVYKTDALISQKVKIVGTFPENSHKPIVYPIAVTTKGQNNPDAIQFEKFVKEDPQAKAIFEHYGFSVKPHN